MSREVSPLRQRIRDAGLTPQDVATALNIPLIVDKVLDGAPAGQTYDRVVNWLNQVEHDSYQPVAAPRLTEADRLARAQAAADEAFLAPRRARQEAQARVDLWQAQERERILEERALATAKYADQAIERAVLGNELRELREEAKLGLSEVAAFIGTVDASMLDRMERGRPLGCKLDTIEAIYRTLPKFTGRKVVAK
jgi:transcriptional regulator with XRE-family HTH domain